MVLVLCLFSCITAIRNDTRTAKLIRNGFVALSAIIFIFTVSKWPGGDDGPLIGLVCIVGPFLFFEMVLSTISTISIFKDDKRGKCQLLTLSCNSTTPDTPYPRAWLERIPAEVFACLKGW